MRTDAPKVIIGAVWHWYPWWEQRFQFYMGNQCYHLARAPVMGTKASILYGNQLVSVMLTKAYTLHGNHCTPFGIVIRNENQCSCGNHCYRLALASATRTTLITRFMGPTWGPPGADRTQVGPMLAPWISLSGKGFILHRNQCNRLVRVSPMRTKAWKAMLPLGIGIPNEPLGHLWHDMYTE